MAATGLQRNCRTAWRRIANTCRQREAAEKSCRDVWITHRLAMRDQWNTREQ